MRNKIITIALAAATLLVQAPAPAKAYNLTGNQRAGNSTTLYLNPWVQLFLPDHYTALQNAANKLSANPSNMRFAVANDNDVVFAVGNGESEIDFVNDPVLLCNSLACTWNISSGGTITESDVFFDVDYDWTTTDLKADSVAYTSSGFRPILNTALHEFSHTLGMAHESDVFQVLGNAWNVVNTNGDHTESVISEDTSNGLIDLYGQRPTVNEDLSLYHWEWVGSSGSYSQHGRTTIETSTGGALAVAPSFDPSLNEPAYYTTSGQTIQVTQTAENRGTTQTVTIQWFLSTNSLITTSDTLLATSAITKARNGPFTWTRTMTLPGGLTSGQRYWVGAIIDSTNVLAEQNESNNAIYVAEIVIL